MTQQYEVTWSDGNTYQVDAPEGMSESDVLAQFEIDMGGSTEAQPEPEVGDLGDAFKRSLVSTKGAGQQFVADRLEDTAQNAPKSFTDILKSNSNPTTELLGAYASPSALGESAFDYLTSRPAYTELFGDTSPEERAIEAQIAVGETANELSTIPRVPAMNRVAKAEGAGDTISALFENGLIDAGEGILALGAESSVPALAAITTGLVTRNPTVGAAAMGAASGAQERYSQPIEFFSKRGFDLSKREDVERMLASPELMEEAKQKGFTRGIIIGAFAALGGKVASSTLAQAPVKNFTAQMVAQPTIDMTGEVAASGITEGKINWKDVVLEGLGGLATAPVEVIGLNSDIRASIAAKKNKTPDQVTNEDLIDEAVEGNQAAADVLRQMGVTEEQLATMPVDRQEQLAGLVETRQAEDAARLAPQEVGKVTNRQFRNNQERLAAEREGIEAGDIDPAAASTAGRTRDSLPEVMTVGPTNRGFTEEQRTLVLQQIDSAVANGEMSPESATQRKAEIAATPTKSEQENFKVYSVASTTGIDSDIKTHLLCQKKA